MQKFGIYLVALMATFAACIQAAEPGSTVKTVADPVLKKDIIANLLNAHRTYHPECKDVQEVGAKTLSVSREKASEEWVLSGCGKSYPYTIELIADGKGGAWINIPRDKPEASIAKVLSCKAPFSSPDDWLKIGGGDTETLYANVGSARLNGHIASMWLLSDNKTLQRESYGAFMSNTMLVEFDCQGKKTRFIGENSYTGKMATGPVVSCDSIAHEWRPIRPGTVEEAATEIACNPDAKYRYCTAPSISVADWTKLDQRPDETNYINAKSAHRAGDTASVWILNELRSPQPAAPGKTYSSVEVKYEFDCKANTRRMASQFFWAGKMAGGTRIGCNLNRGDWNPIRSGSLGESWRDIACAAPASK